VILEPLELTRDKLIRGVVKTKEPEYKQGYIDAILDFFNDRKKTSKRSKKETKDA